MQVSRLEKIAEAFGIELLELFSFGERNVFYLVTDNHQNNENNANCKNLQSIYFSDDKKELEHELEKARLLLQQKDKEIVHLNKIISLLEK